MDAQVTSTSIPSTAFSWLVLKAAWTQGADPFFLGVVVALSESQHSRERGHGLLISPFEGSAGRQYADGYRATVLEPEANAAAVQAVEAVLARVLRSPPQ